MKSLTAKNPFIFTIFGASGDLAKLKIFPALYQLMEQDKMPDDFCIVGFARTAKSRSDFQKEFRDSIKQKIKKVDAKVLKKLLEHVYYFAGQYSDLSDFQSYQKFLKQIGAQKMIHIAYFAVPPIIFRDIIENLGKTKKKSSDTRLILEKPFGNDLESARNLFHFVGNYFEEGKVYLLDHYLGKFAVQSVLNMRHSNRILGMMMKGPEVANIQITATEDFGVQNRFGYYDRVGSFKDMIQSHLLQVLSLVTMSIPISYSDASLHREKYSILSAIKFNNAKKNIVLGQYDTYAAEAKKEAGIAKTNTETFAAIRLFIDRESWYKTPIYIRTGKNLHRKGTYIVIELKKYNFQNKETQPNRLVIELQPEPKIHIHLVNHDGHRGNYEEISPTHSLRSNTKNTLPEHANLLLDVIHENKMNFISFPEVIAAWRLTDKVMKFMGSNDLKIEKYKNLSNGPQAQHFLTKRDGFKWYEL